MFGSRTLTMIQKSHVHSSQILLETDVRHILNTLIVTHIKKPSNSPPAVSAMKPLSQYAMIGESVALLNQFGPGSMPMIQKSHAHINKLSPHFELANLHSYEDAVKIPN